MTDNIDYIYKSLYPDMSDKERRLAFIKDLVIDDFKAGKDGPYVFTATTLVTESILRCFGCSAPSYMFQKIPTEIAEVRFHYSKLSGFNTGIVLDDDAYGHFLEIFLTDEEAEIIREKIKPFADDINEITRSYS